MGSIQNLFNFNGIDRQFGTIGLYNINNLTSEPDSNNVQGICYGAGNYNPTFKLTYTYEQNYKKDLGFGFRIGSKGYTQDKIIF